MKKYSDQEIKNKLIGEFESLDEKKQKTNSDVKAVVVLAAEETLVTGENKDRIDEGLKIVKRLKTKPLLLFLGTRTHNEHANSYLKLKDVNYKLIPSYAQANTKDQIVDFKKNSSKHPVETVAIVSHLYHIPRIKRYCKKIIPNINIIYWKIGKLVNFKKEVDEEIEKIMNYSKKGDLPLYT